MNAFKQASTVEVRSWEILEPYIERHSLNGRFVTTDKGRLSRELQKTVGDVLLNNDKGEIVAIELKAEERNPHGNFFIETWSNKSRFTPGRLYTLNTDVLLYHFLESDELYVINFQKMREWLFKDCNGFPNINKYREREQGKYDQLNDTWGRCVKISDIGEHVGFRTHNPLKELRGAGIVREAV